MKLFLYELRKLCWQRVLLGVLAILLAANAVLSSRAEREPNSLVFLENRMV